MGGRQTVRTVFSDELEVAAENLRDARQLVMSALVMDHPRADRQLLIDAARGHLVAVGDALDRAVRMLHDPAWLLPLEHPMASRASVPTIR